MKYLIWLLLILSILYTSCIQHCIAHYDFEVPLVITPQESTLQVGDTLHVLMITANKSMYDSYGNRVVEFPKFDPNAIFNLPIIDTIPVNEGFLHNDLIVDTSLFDAQIGNTEHLGLGLFFFDIPKDEYESKIEFKVVLNTPGQYMLVCRDALFLSDKSKPRRFPDRCKDDGDLSVLYIIEQGDNNHILNDDHQEVLEDYWENSSGDKAESDKYYFKVVE